MTELTSVVESNAYLAAAESHLSEAERAEIVDLIAADPAAGVVIPGTGGLRKLRIGMSGRGKRGGGRLIYWYHSEGYPAVLLFIFAKNEADDLNPERRKMLARITEALIGDFGGKR